MSNRTWWTRVSFRADRVMQVIADSADEAVKIAQMSAENIHYTENVEINQVLVWKYGSEAPTGDTPK